MGVCYTGDPPSLMALVYKATRNLNSNTLRMLYCALFLPYLNYCVEVWGTASKCYTSLITLVQKKVIRVIAKVDKCSHIRSFI